MFDFIDREYPDAGVSPEYIDAFEKEKNIRLPAILRNYYLAHNGAEIVECPFEKGGLEFCVILVYALGYGSMPIEKIMAYNSRNDAIPSTYIPLAQDEDEDDYYWDSESGKVYYLSLENVEHPIPICDSVEEFFDILNESC